MEFSGSLGDLGLFIPLVAAMTVACDLNIGAVLILAGVMNVVTGLMFRQPIPVQPMKAIAAVVITESLLPFEMVAAGIIMGVLLIILSGYIDRINETIPKAVVRGIQMGVGLKLVLKGISWVRALPLLGWDSVVFALVVAVVLWFLLSRNIPALLYVFIAGFIVLYFKQPEAYASVTFGWPVFSFDWPRPSEWVNGFYKGALAQLPVTVLNSVIAVCALSAQYFPNEKISPKRMALSVGLMNIFCVPLGGIPMCHGAGGLAAQYRFGARTGGSVIMLGFLKIVAGLLFGAALIVLLQNYPMAILGPMLIFAGVELAKSARDVLVETKGLVIVIVSAAAILGVNTAVGFLAGSLTAFIFYLNERKLK